MEVMPLKFVDLAQSLKQTFALKYSPVGFYVSTSKPAKAISFMKDGTGCIMPLIFAAARGKTVAFEAQSCGYPCSAFYLGYTDWIFPGIEHFLSNGTLLNPRCERFIKTPAQAKCYIESLKPAQKTEGYTIFKPLEVFNEQKNPRG